MHSSALLCMAKLLGLDIGDVRVGVALADSRVGIAEPHETLDRGKRNAEKEILSLITNHNIEIVVAGLPLDAEGNKTAQCEKVENFCKRLLRRASFTLHYVDEHLTTVEAEQQLISSGRAAAKRARHKGVLDAVSASIILQTYLDQGGV
jgi:putative holliday junction resolvase